MANNTELEAKILEAKASGMSDEAINYMLMSGGYDATKITQAKSVLEKKNPGATAFTESGSVEPPLDSLSNEVEPPNDVLSWLDQATSYQIPTADGGIQEADSLEDIQFGGLQDNQKPFFDRKTVVAFGRGKEASADKYESIRTGPAAAAIERRRNLQMISETEEGKLETGEPGVMSAMYSASQANPEDDRYRWNSLSERMLTERIANNPDFTNKLNERKAEIEELEANIKEANYRDIKYPVKGAGNFEYMETRTAAQQQEADRKKLESLKYSAVEFTNGKYLREGSRIIEEAYKSLLGAAPETYWWKSDSEEFNEWKAKVERVEKAVYGMGYVIDIDDDGYVGVNKFDTPTDILMAFQQASDMLVYGSGPLLSLLDASLGSEKMGDYTRDSAARRKHLQSQSSVRANNAIEDIEYGEFEWSSWLSYLSKATSQAIQSSPTSVGALVVGAITKNPYATAGAISYVTGAQKFYESKIDSSFDEFSIDGRPLNKADDMRVLGAIDKMYKAKGFDLITDDSGTYLLLEGGLGNSTRVDVKVNDDVRWGYSVAGGIAEGVPEAVGSSIMLKAAGLWGKGFKVPLTNMMKGVMVNLGIGTLTEAPQEAATELMNIMTDAALRGEHMTIEKAMGRVFESALTGGISGGPTSAALFGVNMAFKGKSGKMAFFGHQQYLARSIAAGKVEGIGVNVTELSQKAEKLRDENTSEEEKRQIEYEFQEQIEQAKAKDEQAKQLILDLAKIDPLASIELAQALQQLTSLTRGKANSKKKLNNHLASAVASEQIGKAKEQAQQAIAKAEQILSKAESESGVVSEAQTEGLLAEDMSTADQLQADWATSTEEVAEALGLSQEQAQTLLDNPLTTPTTVLAASRLIKKGGNVVVYESPEAYLAAVEESELVQRQRAQAQYDPKTNTVHLSPAARAIDVLEEAVHRTLKESGITEDQITEMYETLKASEDPKVKEIVDQREKDYSESADKKEEVVVGVLREGLGVNTGNRDFDKLNKQVKKDFVVEVAAAQMSAVSYNDQRYKEIERQFGADGVKDLRARYGDPVIQMAAENLGIDLETVSFDQLTKITKELTESIPYVREDVVDSKITVPDLKTAAPELESLIKSNPALAQDIKNGKKVRIITVRQDGTGVNTIDFNGSFSKTYLSGVGAEIKAVEEAGKNTAVVARSSKGVVTNMINALTTSSAQNKDVSDQVIIMVELMGSQATRGGELVSIVTFRDLQNSLSSQPATGLNRKKAYENATEVLLNYFEDIKIYKGEDAGVQVKFKYSIGSKNRTEFRRFENQEAADKALEQEKENIKKAQEELDAGASVPQVERQASIEIISWQTFPQTTTAASPIWSSSLGNTSLIESLERLRLPLDPKPGGKAIRERDVNHIIGLLIGGETQKLTFENREALIKKIQKSGNSILTPLDEVMESVRAAYFDNVDIGDAEGNVIAAITGKLENYATGEVSTIISEESLYKNGINIKSPSMVTFNKPVSIEAIMGESEARHRGQIQKFQVDIAAKNLASLENTKDSFMGLPSEPFEMTFIENKPVGYKGINTSDEAHTKVFQDSWHFWNWWVMQTGNGKSSVIDRFSYIKDGKREFLKNIPTKKDKNTREPLAVGVKWQTWAGKNFDKRQREEAERLKSKEERTEAAMSLSESLRARLNDSPVSMNMSALDRDFPSPETLARENEPTLKYDTFSNPSYMTHLQYMENRLNQLEGMQSAETGATLNYNPSDLSLFDESVFASTTMVGLASKEVKATEQGVPTLKDMNTFFDQYNFLFESTDNVKHSVTKTENGWKLDVNLAVSGSIESLAKEATDVPQSKEELIEFVEALNNGEKSTPKDSRIMPPRYYQQREENGAFQGTVNFLNTWLVNKYADVLKLQGQVEEGRKGEVKPEENFQEIEQLMYGRSRAAMEDLDAFMEEAKQFMIVNEITHTDLSQFMYALHAAERNDVIMGNRPDLVSGSGMPNELAQEVLDNLDSPEMRAAAKMFQDIIADTRKTMIDEGLESQARIDAWNDMYENYVPLQGFAEDEMTPASNAYPHGGAGFSVYGSKVKKAVGRESEAANVLANIIMQNALTHQWAEKNRALQSLYKLAEANDASMEGVMHVLDKDNPLLKVNDEGEQDHMTLAEMHADPHTVAVRVDGSQKFIYFNDPYYASVMNGMTMEQSNTFIKMLRAPVSFLRGVFTQWNPNFFVGNFARDMGASIYNAEADMEEGGLGKIDQKGFQKQMMSNTWGSLRNLLGEAVTGKEMDAETQQFFDEWREDGGQTGWNYVKELEQIAAELSVEANDLSKGQKLKQKLFSSPKKFLEFVEGVNDAFENSIRLSAYTTARQRGATRQKAAVFSKNITVNFNRSGEAGPTINAIYLFFNASIQGNVRVYNSIAKSKPAQRPDGSTREWYERASNPQKIAAGMTMFSGMLTLINLALSGKDPEDDISWYDKVSEYDKQRNMIICYGKDRDNFLKIPLPYGFGLFNNAGLALAETSTGHRTLGEATMFLGSSAFNSFSPISFGGEVDNPGTFVLRSAAPTVFKPFVEMAENRTYFGSMITGEQLPFGTPRPNSELSFRSPDALREYFQWMNQATGGSEYTSGDIDLNPDYGWYLFEYLIGGTGDFVLDSGKQARNMYEMSKRSLNKAKESKDVGELIKALGYGFSDEGEVKINYNDVPIIKKIYGEASPFYDIAAFKENDANVGQLYREIQNNSIIDEPGRYNGIQALKEESKKVNKELKALRAALKKARKVDDYIDRQNQIWELQEMMRGTMARFNKKYNTLRGE